MLHTSQCNIDESCVQGSGLRTSYAVYAINETETLLMMSSLIAGGKKQVGISTTEFKILLKAV